MIFFCKNEVVHTHKRHNPNLVTDRDMGSNSKLQALSDQLALFKADFCLKKRNTQKPCTYYAVCTFQGTRLLGLLELGLLELGLSIRVSQTNVVNVQTGTLMLATSFSG